MWLSHIWDNLGWFLVLLLSNLKPYPLPIIKQSIDLGRSTWAQRAKLPCLEIATDLLDVTLATHCHTTIITSTQSTSCFCMLLSNIKQQLFWLLSNRQTKKLIVQLLSLKALSHDLLFPSVGLELSDIQLCVNWMQPCATILSQKGVVVQKTFSGVRVIHNCVYYLSGGVFVKTGCIEQWWLERFYPGSL